MNDKIISTYQDRFPCLQRVADKLRGCLQDLLAETPRIDAVSARAKNVDSFVVKAMKVLPSGNLKYNAPLIEIQDQIGARIVVYYIDDVKIVADVLERYFRQVERQDHVPDSHWEFGYFGRHWIFALPGDVIPRDVDVGDVPRFFELQVKTLFQHAWSETNHDLAYKEKKLTSDQKRRFAYTAAQAWGADRVLEELRCELDGRE